MTIRSAKPPSSSLILLSSPNVDSSDYPKSYQDPTTKDYSSFVVSEERDY